MNLGGMWEKTKRNWLKIPATAELRLIATQGKKTLSVKTLISGLILVNRGEVMREGFQSK